MSLASPGLIAQDSALELNIGREAAGYRGRQHMTLHEDSTLHIEVCQRQKHLWFWLPIGLLMVFLTVTSTIFLGTNPPEWMFVALNFGWAIVALTLLVKLSGVCCAK
jgi:membrane protein insertase Oxa1/YidC/SpoIIIJ